jgi:hypothetical protein
MKNYSELLKKPEMPIALSIVEGCAQSPRSSWLIAYGLWHMGSIYTPPAISHTQISAPPLRSF